jgi:magnesium transporter
MALESLVHNDLAWTNIEKPTSEEMGYLQERYPFFHPLDLEDCLSKIERPKIDEYENYLFIVMHFPVFDKMTRRLGSSQVAIFVGQNFLVTVSDGSLKPLVQDFAGCQQNEEFRERFMGRGSNYLLYEVIDSLVDYCFPILDKESQNIERVEERIFEEDARKMMREISIIRRNLINLRRIIRPQMAVIASLERKDWEFLRGDMDVYWGDVSDHTAQIWDRLQDLREVIEGLGDTIDSLTSHSLNEVMKYLAIIAITFGSLEAISGIYGMNIPLPLAGSPFAFLIILGIMGLVSGIMFLFFRKARWL